MLADEQAEAFVRYYELLVEWNSRMNLTGITEPDEVMVKHFADSLWGMHPRGRVLDVGSGAGFPGLPLAIAWPEAEFVLMDSLGKRVNFLNAVIGELGLGNVKAIHARAEELARQPEHREAYELVVSRAVSRLNILSEYCLPFVRVGGEFVAYKSAEYMQGEESAEAAAAIKLLGGCLAEEQTVKLPGQDYARVLVHIRKEEKTPKKYPRKAGTPAKEPLK